MVLKQIQTKNTVQRWAVYDKLGNELFVGSLQDAGAYYDANKDKEVVDAHSIDGQLIDEKHNNIAGIKLNTGWKDLKAKFSVASQGANAPTVTDLPNGVRIRKFGVNDSMHIEYHIDHDYKLGTIAFPHIHLFASADMQIGETITWDFIYVGAKGYAQGDNFLAPRNTITLTYTATEVVTAGDHIIIEGDAEILGFDLLEPDTQFLCEVKYTGGTFAGLIYGIQADIHFLSDHETTIGKRPNFDEAD